MSKRKPTLAEKEKRRIKEAAKAESRVRTGNIVVSYSPKESVQVPPKQELRYSLPIKEIKKDLVKNAIYMLVVVSVLIVLKSLNLTL